MSSGSLIKLNSRGELWLLFNRIEDNIKNFIKSKQDSYILNVAEESFIQYVEDSFTLNEITLSTDGVYGESDEISVLLSQDPNAFVMGFDGAIDRDKYVRRIQYTYYFNISDQSNLLGFSPSTFTLSPLPQLFKKYVEENVYYMEYIDFTNNNGEKTYEKFVSEIERIKIEIDRINKDAKGFNKKIEGLVRNVFTRRKKELLNRREQLASIPIPMKKKGDVNQTYSVPVVGQKKRIRVEEPEMPNSKFFKPEPTLEDNAYNDIICSIVAMGRSFEQTPQAVDQLGEEGLRDHLLVNLKLLFNQGTVSGETFNKSGKTDILLRNIDDSNLFIGECKFWRGQASLTKTIDQLIGYLTWRDTKTAVVMFVDQKGIEEVIEKAKNAIKEHSSFVRLKEHIDESTFKYTFKFENEGTREFQLTLMLFHIPRKDK